MEEQLTQIIEQLPTVAGALIAAFGAILKTRDAYIRLSNSKPLLRRAITADLELLGMMDKEAPAYQALQNHIRSQVEKMITEKEKTEGSGGDWRDRLEKFLEFLRKNLVKLGFWLAIAGGFGYWTYDIVTGPTSNWWTILTGWMALWAIQSLIGLATKRPPDKASTTAQASEGDPGQQPNYLAQIELGRFTEL